MTRKMLHSKIMIFLLIAFVLLFPSTINMPDQTQTYSVVLGVGIDKSGDEFEISTQVLTSKTNQGFLESLQVHSTKGENILDAVEKLSVHLGRISGFGNTSVLVFSEEVAKEGIAEMLDFFIRSKRLNGNPFILVTQKSAKDLLSDVAKIDESFNYSLNSLAKLNSEFASGTILTLEDFLNNYYGGTTASIIAQINETTNEDDGILVPEGNGTGSGGASGDSGGGDSGGEMGGQSQGGSSGGASQSSKKVISNTGQSSLFVGSKQVAVLSPEDLEGINILLGLKRNSATVENVTDNIYQNATVALSVKNSVKTKSLKFKNGIPQVYFDIHYVFKVEQIMQNGNDQIILNGSNNYITPALKQKIREKILTYAAKSVNLCKEYNADVYGLQDAFYKFHPKQWKKYIKSLPDKSTAFQNIEFFLNIKISGNL